VVLKNLSENWLIHYSQVWLIAVTLLVLVGSRVGKIVGWFAVLLNLVLCWSELDFFFGGN
jgi:hypothetical protein